MRAALLGLGLLVLAPITRGAELTFVPTILSHPQSSTNLVCGQARFAVEATGTGALAYLWRLDGQPLADSENFSGTHGPVLTINRLRHQHAGHYDVLVRAPNVVTSQVATLTLEATAEWLLRATNGPPPRFGHAMAFDSARGVTVLFGGRTNNADGQLVPLNDLWEWDGARWMSRSENLRTRGWTNIAGVGWRVAHRERPVQRAHHAMCFDGARGRVIIFGGETRAPDGTQVFLNDLWEWDGAQWLFRSTNGPQARFYGSMAYDEGRGRVVLFGGWPVPGEGLAPDQDIVWEWDGAEWHRDEPEHRPDASTFLTGARIVYDSHRDQTVFGPAGNHFWTWNGTNWARAVTNALLNAADGGVAYNKRLRRAVWFGGQKAALSAQTYSLNGQQWSFLATSGVRPAPRMNLAMAYDSRRSVMVMFGGDTTAARGSAGTNDTWELMWPDAPVIVTQPTSQYRRVGETAVFAVHAAGRGLLSYRWYRVRPGMPDALVPQLTDALTLSGVQAEDAGEYRVVVSSPCGGSTSRSAVLTIDSGLQLFRSGSTVSMLWLPETRVIFETAERVEGPWAIVANPPVPFNIGTFGRAGFFRLRPLP